MYSPPAFVTFDTIISVPASPNPRAKRVPVFVMAFSIIYVSNSFSGFLVLGSLKLANLALRGSYAILLTFAITRSIGFKASSLASELNESAAIVIVMQTKSVLAIFRIESN